MTNFADGGRTLGPTMSVDDEAGWLVEEDATGFVHWIALAKDQWPRAERTVRRDRMNADLDVETTTWRNPVVRVRDANQALRFARKEDAEAFITLFDRFLLHAKATEHMWASAALAHRDAATGADPVDEARDLALRLQSCTNAIAATEVIRDFLAHRDAAWIDAPHGVEAQTELTGIGWDILLKSVRRIRILPKPGDAS